MLVQVLWSCTFASWTPPPPTFSITFADFFRVYCRFQFFCCSRDLCCCFSFVVMHFAWPGNNKKTTHTQHNKDFTIPLRFNSSDTTKLHYLGKKNAQMHSRRTRTTAAVFFSCVALWAGWLLLWLLPMLRRCDMTILHTKWFCLSIFFLLLHSLLLLQLFS